MINLERLEQAIEVMERAGVVKMWAWQGYAPRVGIQSSEIEMHSCGNSACFAGWVAASPEFQAAGGEVGDRGTPQLRSSRGHSAIIRWLEAEGFKAEVVELLVLGVAYISNTTEEWFRGKNIPVEVEPNEVYQFAFIPEWRDFKAQDVIKILEALRD